YLSVADDGRLFSNTTLDVRPFISFGHCRRDHRALPSFPTRRSSDLPPAGCCCSAPGVAPGRGNAPVNLRIDLALESRNSRTTSEIEEHTSELQSRFDLVCRLLLEKKKIESEARMVGRNHRSSRRLTD